MILVGGFAALALSLGMLAAFTLIGGGVFRIVRRRDRKQGLLMIGAGGVMIMNVLIWAWPMSH